MISRTAFVAAFAALLSGGAHAGTVYHVTDLGTSSGPNHATGVNAQGAVCVSLADAFLVAPGGSVTDLGGLRVGGYSGAQGINANQVIVGYATVDRFNTFTHAFSWKKGVMTDLGTLSGEFYTNSYAVGVNKTGDVAGASGTTAGSTSAEHAFLYTGGTLHDLGVLPGMTTSDATGINDLGHVVGVSSDHRSSVRAFMYRDGAMVDIGAFGGGAGFAVAYAINAKDQIAGQSSPTPGVGPADAKAFLDTSGKMKNLGVARKGDTCSAGYGLNAKGTVVGMSGVDCFSSDMVAMVYQGGRMSDLNTLLDASGAGWRLTLALGVNDAGTIVGTGIFGGVTHAFKAVPVAL